MERDINVNKKCFVTNENDNIYQLKKIVNEFECEDIVEIFAENDNDAIEQALDYYNTLIKLINMSYKEYENYLIELPSDNSENVKTTEELYEYYEQIIINDLKLNNNFNNSIYGEMLHYYVDKVYEEILSVDEQIIVGVYYYENEETIEPVYDIESMRDEFEEQLRTITGDQYYK